MGKHMIHDVISGEIKYEDRPDMDTPRNKIRQISPEIKKLLSLLEAKGIKIDEAELTK